MKELVTCLPLSVGPRSLLSFKLSPSEFNALRSLLGHPGFGHLCYVLTELLPERETCRGRSSRPRYSCKTKGLEMAPLGPPRRGDAGGDGPCCRTYPSPLHSPTGSELKSSFDFYEGWRDQANKPSGFSQSQRVQHMLLPSLPSFHSC